MKRPPIIFAFLYFIAMTVACTFPMLQTVNRVRPFIFGLPFMLIWFSGWVVGAMIVFGILYNAEKP